MPHEPQEGEESEGDTRRAVDDEKESVENEGEDGPFLVDPVHSLVVYRPEVEVLRTIRLLYLITPGKSQFCSSAACKCQLAQMNDIILCKSH